ncbi:MAG TPA: GNAT family N-acetyltransferase [Alphaproteobacteria bacterium]
MFSDHRHIIRAAFERQKRGENVMLVALADGFPAGQAWIDLVKKRHEKIAVIWAVRVHPTRQRLGIGQCLMTKAEQIAAANAFRFTEIGVERDNAGVIPFYRRLGYHLQGSEAELFRYETPDGRTVERVIDQWLFRKPVGAP